MAITAVQMTRQIANHNPQTTNQATKSEYDVKEGTPEMPKQESSAENMCSMFNINKHDDESKLSNNDRLDAIIDFLERSEKELDIYQLVAFRLKSGNKPRENGAYWGYYMDIVKAFIIMLTQVVSIVVLYIKIFSDRSKGYCDGNGEFESRVMASCYCAFLSLIIFTTFTSTSHAGFYLHLSYKQREYKFISSLWLHFGRAINETTLISAYILSIFLILLTDDPLDMVLNSIALLFITEIDNDIVDVSDYLKTLSWFKEVQRRADSYTNGEEYINDMFKTEPMNACLVSCLNIVYYAILIVSGLVMVVSPALPILMYICY